MNHATTSGPVRWPRVTSRHHCPVCNASKYCRLSPDGAVAGCMKIDRGAFKIATTGLGPMYLHRLRDDCPSMRRPLPRERRSTATTAVASADYRHAVYSAFLEGLTLSPRHAAELRDRRGLTEETVTLNRYATFPYDSREHLSTLARNFELQGVPGFYRDDDRWRCEARPGELLIPARDERGRISAILRGTGGVPKYVWMSNADRGASCGTPLHFAQAYRADLYRGMEVIITEGVLKADCIAEQTRVPVVGCPGTVIPEDIASRIVARFPSAGLVTVAFDADSATNPHVRSAVLRVLQLLGAAGVTADRLEWDAELGKGLDDVLLGGVA